jgi:hypothetical protein
VRTPLDAEAHEPLAGQAWDEGRAREAIARIVAEADDAFDDEQLWPIHPRDVYEGVHGPSTTFWSGASGVIWALERLREQGAAAPARGYATLLPGIRRLYRAHPEVGTEPAPGLLFGECGIALAELRFAGGSQAADALLELAERASGHESNEICWGEPGTMHAARWAAEITGDERFRRRVREAVERIWAGWLPMPDVGCRLWTQRLYGTVTQYVGAGHGFASNMRCLWSACALVAPERLAELAADGEETADVLAWHVDGGANWPPTAEPESWEQVRVQWCHGAPGMATSLVVLPAGERIDALLRAAGELTWRAGPLRKGHGLCHGTAGNGLAFLALHRRTGEEVWLERARAFAMHALDQYESALAREGRGRFSLFTGDVGLALYLWQCICEEPGVPLLDLL